MTIAAEDGIDPRVEAAKAALDEWAHAWAAHHGTGEAHAAAIRAWAAPTRPDKPAPPATPNPDRTAERVSYYLERAAHTIERIKQRRGYSLYEPLPGGGGDWNTRHCGREGCPCTHGKFRSQGDHCDRGFIPTRGDPDGESRTARCPACQRYATEKAKAT